MRNELLKVIRSGLSDAVSERDDVNFEEKVQAVVVRIPTLKVRLRTSSYCECVDKWYMQLFLSCSREVVERIVCEIDQLVGCANQLESFLFANIATNKVTSDIVELLDEAVERGIALPQDPPWKYKHDILPNGDVLSLVDTKSIRCSTEQLLEQFRTIFQKIISLNHPRPKLWILPVVGRGRAVIAMGNQNVVNLLLKPVISFHVSSD